MAWSPFSPVLLLPVLTTGNGHCQWRLHVYLHLAMLMVSGRPRSQTGSKAVAARKLSAACREQANAHTRNTKAHSRTVVQTSDDHALSGPSAADRPGTQARPEGPDPARAGALRLEGGQDAGEGR